MIGYDIVVANAVSQIAAFDKAFKHGKANPMSVWAEIEGMAYFLNFEPEPMLHCDDSDGVAALASLIGHALLNTILGN